MRKGFEFDAKSVDAHMLLAEILYKTGTYRCSKRRIFTDYDSFTGLASITKADETYHRMISLFPDSADMHYELALNHLEKGEYEESIKEFKLVLESDPNHIPTLSKIGEIYIGKDMLEEGIDNFKKVLDLDPRNSAIRETLVDVYLSIGQIDEALEQLLTLGNVYVEKEQFEPAIGVYRRVLCYMPVNLDVREKIVEVILYRVRQKSKT